MAGIERPSCHEHYIGDIEGVARVSGRSGRPKGAAVALAALNRTHPAAQGVRQGRLGAPRPGSGCDDASGGPNPVVVALRPRSSRRPRRCRQWVRPHSAGCSGSSTTGHRTKRVKLPAVAGNASERSRPGGRCRLTPDDEDRRLRQRATTSFSGVDHAASARILANEDEPRVAAGARLSVRGSSRRRVALEARDGAKRIQIVATFESPPIAPAAIPTVSTNFATLGRRRARTATVSAT